MDERLEEQKPISEMEPWEINKMFDEQDERMAGQVMIAVAVIFVIGVVGFITYFIFI